MNVTKLGVKNMRRKIINYDVDHLDFVANLNDLGAIIHKLMQRLNGFVYKTQTRTRN